MFGPAGKRFSSLKRFRSMVTELFPYLNNDSGRKADLAMLQSGRLLRECACARTLNRLLD